MTESDDRPGDSGTRLILEELRDLRVEMREDRRRSDERFERIVTEFREDSLRRDAAFQAMFGEVRGMFVDIRSVGLAIVKTLNRHTRILQRIERNLGARRNGPEGRQDDGQNGRG